MPDAPDWWPPPEFFVETESWGRAIRCRVLPAGARHLFSTRDIDVHPDAPGFAVAWSAVAESVGVPAGALVRARQVHGRDVLVVSAAGGPRSEAGMVEADVLITDAPAVAVSVRVADCVPLLVADARLGVVAAAHAGWRGTALDVAGTTVRALAMQFGSRPRDLHVALGPSIGPDVYEVGEEVRAAFAGNGHAAASIRRWFRDGARDRPHLDVWQANVDQLVAAGVPLAQVACARACTATHAAWFHSHRRDGAAAGRMVAVIRAFTPTPAP